MEFAQERPKPRSSTMSKKENSHPSGRLACDTTEVKILGKVGCDPADPKRGRCTRLGYDCSYQGRRQHPAAQADLPRQLSELQDRLGTYPSLSILPPEPPGDHERLVQRLLNHATPIDRGFEEFDLLTNLAEGIPGFGETVDLALTPGILPLLYEDTPPLPLSLGSNYALGPKQGRCNSPTDFSHEIGGVVTRVGAATIGYALGDRVIEFSLDKFATIQRIHKSLLQKLQPGETLPEMASLPMAYTTALYGLKNLAHLQESETILILPSSGLAGAAAIGISRAFGGYPYVIATSATEAEFIRSHFELDSSQVILTSEVSKLRDMNGQYKVDVIFASPKRHRKQMTMLTVFGPRMCDLTTLFGL
ncbi:Acyl transferase/acyl hydrolase/lysophospholipase [Penicillium cf. viridicatum]|uniref:Acyl transferase/acyl hydrolase/lysophospholipase n=1 Tax=Penicillium cf. viridicatum TaxID=2972119 RepID=A0A9W9J0A8_9EURO|nr:Acyl transferase/acyl hydrolase/lysophospholipase [Penicillium cf. viridicatum]